MLVTGRSLRSVAEREAADLEAFACRVAPGRQQRRQPPGEGVRAPGLEEGPTRPGEVHHQPLAGEDGLFPPAYLVHLVAHALAERDDVPGVDDHLLAGIEGDLV